MAAVFVTHRSPPTDSSARFVVSIPPRASFAESFKVSPPATTSENGRSGEVVAGDCASRSAPTPPTCRNADEAIVNAPTATSEGWTILTSTPEIETLSAGPGIATPSHVAGSNQSPPAEALALRTRPVGPTKQATRLRGRSIVSVIVALARSGNGTSPTQWRNVQPASGTAVSSQVEPASCQSSCAATVP